MKWDISCGFGKEKARVGRAEVPNKVLLHEVKVRVNWEGVLARISVSHTLAKLGNCKVYASTILFGVLVRN